MSPSEHDEDAPVGRASPSAAGRAGTPAPPEVAASPAADEDRAEADRVNALVLAYRAGRSELLPPIFDALRPILFTSLKRYGGGGRPLPALLESGDLLQQSWLILDNLARRWSPDGGDFGAYVRTVFPWELWRYVRAHSPQRRARSVRVDNVDHDDLLERFGDRPGEDGRAWVEPLIAAEMLDGLDPLPRRALLLHLVEDRTFTQVARALRLTCTGAYREYRRALDRLRLEAGLDVDPGADAPSGRRAIERLVEALHEGAGPDGRLPGRAWVCARAEISEVRFARLMGVLVTRGCVVGRSARRAGRLVHATPAETLAQAEVGGQESGVMDPGRELVPDP